MTSFTASAKKFGGQFIERPFGRSPQGNAYALWKQDPDKEFKAVWVDNDVYEKMASSSILVCTDVLIIGRENGMAYLGRRRTKPAQNYWWFIGGRRQFGQLPLPGACAKFKAETSLTILPNELIFLKEFEYLFKDREQEPQDVGTHTLSHTFAVEIELSVIWQISKCLDRKEYHTDAGLRPIADIDRTEIHPHVLEAYELYQQIGKHL